ncbi:uncharacterized protein LTR77_008391 [Saxophila tyrrhenica]|uniref:Uncharacterized protein n=1 Tax=Saxophila tyrrhenica TaxID=1690608 RepID=A0AAV9P199_9PEZI|nr:hypothetical protein LTR77_008391 [Saxophila tyrrhenica]
MGLGDNVTNTAAGAAEGAQSKAGQVATTGDSARGGLGGRSGTQTTSTGAPAGVTESGNGDKPSSLKIHIQLDLDVEIHLEARIKGDITIGLL